MLHFESMYFGVHIRLCENLGFRVNDSSKKSTHASRYYHLLNNTEHYKCLTVLRSRTSTFVAAQ